MRQIITILLVPFCLVGCEVLRPDAKSPNGSVYVRSTTIPMQRTLDMAEQDCAAHNKTAHYVRSTVINSLVERDVFECRPR